MNVLYLTSVKINSKAGNSTHVREFIQNFTPHADSLTLISPTKKYNKFSEKVSLKVAKYLDIPYLISSTFSISAFIVGFYSLLTSKYDVIYERHNAFGTGCILSKIFSIPCVVEVNGWKSSECGYNNNLFRNIILKIESKPFSLATKIVVVTPNLKRLIRDECNIIEDKIVVIENGANTNLFSPINQKDAKRELKLGQNTTYICFVGNFALWQGVEYLIKAAPPILTACPNTRFLIIGDGIMKREWIQLAVDIGVSDKFIFTGSVPYEQVPMYINASDVCVVPKKPLKSGYSPLKLYEYMACGKPVIATRTDGFEILEESNAGVLINPENSREFADAVIKLLQNEDVSKQMGENGRKYVVENRSWASVAKKVAEVCKNSIAEYKENYNIPKRDHI